VRGNTTVEKLERFMVELGRSVKSSGRVYFTGGASAILLGWRDSTLDTDIKADPEPRELYSVLPRLKDSLDINVEFAWPPDFVPPLPGWESRCDFIRKEGAVSFYHYDFYGQALSKAERLHERDQIDIRQMIAQKLIDPKRLLDLFSQVESELKKYPAIEPEELRATIEGIVQGRI